MKGITYIIFLFFGISISLYAQHQQSYNIRFQSFVEGDMQVIGNNIVNRNIPFFSAKSPFDELGNSVQHNDQFSMEYIDIDNDPITFSSSSALLEAPSKPGKIIYAGLYWAATYPYGKGSTKDYKNYDIEDASRQDFTNVKIKLPGSPIYRNITGIVIYDGEQSEEFKDIMPYVAYADITNVLNEYGNPWGQYTIANIRATQGQIPGGVSAGWTMVVVYESKGSPNKRIITYDGFKDVFKNKVEVEFTGFQTPEEGNIKAELAGAVLEGDHSIIGSRLAISTPGNEVTYLSTATRPTRNFFNSGITRGHHFIESRNPASKNTLGYDIYTLDIPNEANTVIGNDISKVILTMPASLDRYYSFFTALSIRSEVVKEGSIQTKKVVDTEKKVYSKKTEQVKENIQPEIIVIGEIQQNVERSVQVEPKEEQVKENIQPEVIVIGEIQQNVEKNVQAEPKEGQVRESIQPKEKEQTEVILPEVKASENHSTGNISKVEIKNTQAQESAILRNLSLKEAPKGFYNIVAVYITGISAERQKASLYKKGYQADIIYDPASNKRYVYINRSGTFEEALEKQKEMKQNELFKDTWILSVNE